MNRKSSFAAALLCTVLVATVAFPRANADDEIKRLAALMEWKPGTIVADIGAGDGQYAFAAAQIVGPSGKVFATEIDQDKLTKLRSEVAARHLTNVIILESKDADTNLPPECCDAIFLRRVYHHLTRPAEFDAALMRSLKAAGRLAIIDFPPRSGLEPVEGVPANRGGHGIPKDVALQELTSAGFRLKTTIDAWPQDDYLLLLEKSKQLVTFHARYSVYCILAIPFPWIPCLWYRVGYFHAPGGRVPLCSANQRQNSHPAESL